MEVDTRKRRTDGLSGSASACVCCGCLGDWLVAATRARAGFFSVVWGESSVQGAQRTVASCTCSARRAAVLCQQCPIANLLGVFPCSRVPAGRGTHPPDARLSNAFVAHPLRCASCGCRQRTARALSLSCCSPLCCVCCTVVRGAPKTLIPAHTPPTTGNAQLLPKKTAFGGMNRPTAGARFNRQLERGKHDLQLYRLAGMVGLTRHPLETFLGSPPSPSHPFAAWPRPTARR